MKFVRGFLWALAIIANVVAIALLVAGVFAVGRAIAGDSIMGMATTIVAALIPVFYALAISVVSTSLAFSVHMISAPSPSGAG